MPKIVLRAVGTIVTETHTRPALRLLRPKHHAESTQKILIDCNSLKPY